MATVVITLDDKNKMTVQTKMNFTPPLTDELTNAQAMALKILNLVGGHRLMADRHQVLTEHSLLPCHQRSGLAGEAGLLSN